VVVAERLGAVRLEAGRGRRMKVREATRGIADSTVVGRDRARDALTGGSSKVHEDFVTCRECGKEMPAELNVCPECGYVRRRTRATREQERRAIEPASSQVAAVTDAVRSVPRRDKPRRESGGHRARSRRRPPVERGLPAAARHASRYSDHVATRPARPGAKGPRTAEGGEAPELVRSLARRKVYRYGPEKRKRLAFAGELRALAIMLVVGVCLVLMCRAQQGDAAPAQPAPPVTAPASRV
jgi:hypothetical protein